MCGVSANNKRGIACAGTTPGPGQQISGWREGRSAAHVSLQTRDQGERGFFSVVRRLGVIWNRESSFSPRKRRKHRFQSVSQHLTRLSLPRVEKSLTLPLVSLIIVVPKKFIPLIRQDRRHPRKTSSSGESSPLRQRRNR